MTDIDDVEQEVSEDARDAAYVAACAGLGVAKMGETACRAIKTFGCKAFGDEEEAVKTARENNIEDVEKKLAQKLGVNEKVQAVGKGAETAGEFVGGVGVAMAAALVPAGAGAIAAGAGLGAIAALDVSGDLLESAAADGVITGKETVEAVGGGVGMAAIGIAIGEATEMIVGEIEAEVATIGVSEAVEDVAQVTEEVAAKEATEAAAQEAVEGAAEGAGKAVAKTATNEGAEAIVTNTAKKAGKETLSSAIEKAAENASKSMIEETSFNQ